MVSLGNCPAGAGKEWSRTKSIGSGMENAGLNLNSDSEVILEFAGGWLSPHL